jgi:hypothetical protein
LDQYPGAIAGYSLRKLRSAYTGPCLRLSLSTTGAGPYQDIGFVDNVVDTAAILTFIGAGVGSVCTWYDQTGNSNDVIQFFNGQLPRICQAGAINLSNGKPAIYFDGTIIQNYLYRNGIISGSQNRTQIAVYQPTLVNGRVYGIFGQGSSTQANAWSTVGSSSISGFVCDPFYFSGSQTLGANLTLQNTSMKIGSFFYNGTNGFLWKNNTQIDTGVLALNTSTSQLIQLGTMGGSGGASYESLTGNISECVLYLNNQIANANGINTNINSFYTIY